MVSLHRFATPAVLLWLAMVPTTGCGPIDSSTLPPHLAQAEVSVLRVQLLDFDETRPEGIRLWRREEAGGDFDYVSEIRLGGTTLEAGAEYIDYTLVDHLGTPLGVQLSAAVERDGEQATLALWILRFGPEGEFKATVYNAAGESPMSVASVML